MNIVSLDTLPGNPGDISWEPLKKLGRLVTYDACLPEKIIACAAEADVIITNKCRLTAGIIRSLPKLKLICVTATGYDNIDCRAAREQGVTVCNVPAYSTASVAQTAIALLLELTQHCGGHSTSVHAGQWTRASAFSFWQHPLVELADKSMLIVGTGNIGTMTGRIATALGMPVRSAVLPGRPVEGSGPFERVALDDALPETDVLSLHCPLTDLTRGLINAERLRRMKSSVLIVNVSRGPVVVEQDVAEALRAGIIAGYATDVLSSEPPADDNPLLNAPRCIITPHFAWATFESRQRLWDVIAANIKAFLSGVPQNVVNG
jgi:glycerate dehydrogenase